MFAPPNELACPNEGCTQRTAGWGCRAGMRKHRYKCDLATPAQRKARMKAMRTNGATRAQWDLASVRDAR